MPKMVSLKLSKKQQKKRMSVGVDQNPFDWGTRLNFSSSDLINKIPGMSDLNPGEEVGIVARGKVVEVAVTERDGDDEYRRLEIQLTHIGLESNESFDAGFNESE